MWKLVRDSRGATAVEFAMVILPVIIFTMGLIQTCYVIWVDNLLHVAVQAAARCGAIQSTTPPCAGPSLVSAANTVFAPLTNASFTANANCSGAGLVGTYRVSIAFVVNLPLTAQSCYPTPP